MAVKSINSLLMINSCFSTSSLNGPKHKTLPGVYKIPRLNTVLILTINSLGEKGFVI